MKIQKKLTLTILLVVIVPYIWGMLFLYRNIGRNIREMRITLANEYGQSIGGGVEKYFEKLISTVETVSVFDSIREKNWNTAKLSLTEIQKNNPDISAFVLGNPDGTYWYSLTTGNPFQNYLVSRDDTNPDSELKKISDRSYFEELITNNPGMEKKNYISEMFISNTYNKKTISVSTVITGSGSKPEGVIALYVGTDELKAAYTPLTEGFENLFGKNGFILIGNDQGQVISEFSYDKKSASYKDRVTEDGEILLTADLSPALKKSLSILNNPVDGKNYMISEVEKKEFFISRYEIKGTGYSVYLGIPSLDLFAAVHTLGLICLAIGIVILGLICFSLLSVRDAIIKPIISISKNMNYSVDNADLSVRMDTKGRNEISRLGSDINRFIENLHSTISKLKNEAKNMKVTSDNLQGKAEKINGNTGLVNSNIRDLAQKSETQKKSVTQTVSSIKQIVASIENLSAKIDDQSAAVTESSAGIQEMVSNINSISANLDKASKEFVDLSQMSKTGKNTVINALEMVSRVASQSETLLETNNVINTIASQTNLLAMNAAIEAAHAGEAGKGFSVVADEIRKLAEDTSEQSKIIAEELNKIVTDIDTVVKSSGDAGNAFDVMSRGVENAANLTEQISFAMREQSEGSKQVLEALKNIQNITIDIRADSKEMSRQTTLINQEITALNEISEQVHENLSQIGVAVQDITDSTDQIFSDTRRNNASVEELNVLTEKFSL